MPSPTNNKQDSDKAIREVFDTIKQRLDHRYTDDHARKWAHTQLNRISAQLYEDTLQAFPSFLKHIEEDDSISEPIEEALGELYAFLLEEKSCFEAILVMKAVKEKAIALSEDFVVHTNHNQETFQRTSLHRFQILEAQPSELRQELILQLFNRLDESLEAYPIGEYRSNVPFDIITLIDSLIRVETQSGTSLPSEFDERIMSWAGNLHAGYSEFILNTIKRHIEAKNELPADIISMLLRSHIDREHIKELKSIVDSIEHPLLSSGEVWADAVLAYIDKNPKWQVIIEYAKTADTSKPSKTWLKDAAVILKTVDNPEKIIDFLLLVGKPRSKMLHLLSHHRAGNINQMFDRYNVDAAKGLAWMASTFNNDEAARALAYLTETSLKKVRGVGPRNVSLANAGIISLGNIECEAAVTQLAYLKSRVTFKTTLKQIEKALELAAERAGVSKEDLEEMSVPSFGLDEDGKRTEHFAEARAELSIHNGAVSLEYFNDQGKKVKSPPASVKKDFADEVKELKSTVKDIAKMLSATSARVEKHHLSQKTWNYGVWLERYIQSPIVAAISKRLIWRFTWDDNQVDAVWHEDSFKNAQDKVLDIPQTAQVSLWHPIDSETDDVLAWRTWLEEKQIRQPWKQAHREIYLLTDAERTTGSYSNRYAAHILKQHQFNQLCAIRGWRNQLRLCVDDTYNPAMLELPQWDLRAEFWIEGLGEYGEDTTEAGTYLRLTTDQVRFYPLDSAKNQAQAGTGNYTTAYYRQGALSADPISLEDIPALVFSEVMRDVDMFVGVTSVGNDPTWQDGGPEGRFIDYWQDYSFGNLTESAQSRKAVLEQLIPRLKIRDCAEIDGRFLKIKGDIRTYKIHLGSSNIIMEPNDQYLCVVPDSRMNKKVGDVFLPFEGDRTLSLILSKAFLLAEDKKIKDSVIVNQIKR